MTTFQKRLLYALGAVAVLVVGLVVAWRIFSGNAPAEATLDDAVRAIQDASTTTTTAGEAPSTTEGPGESVPSTTAPAPADDVDGTWTVNTDIGEFSFQDATSSFVGFRVAEELRGIGAVDAVGRTPDVSGTIEIDGTTMTDGSFTAELATLTTDRSQRNAAVRRALDTATFPTAMFELADPVEFGAVPTGGESIAVTVPGELTIKGITKAVELELEAQLVDDVIVVVGQIPVVFADFEVSVPSAPVVLSAADNGIIEVQLFFSKR
jgi:polyisoprenoid-binding protein YceI